MLVYRMRGWYTEWGVNIRDGVLEFVMEYSLRDGVFVYGMGCLYIRWGVSI